MSMKEMKTLTIGEDIFEIVDERARGDIETLKDDMPSKPGDVGADPSGTASSEVSAHNTSETSHNDIRLLISGLTTRVNGILDSTDVDLDQLSELVVYIKSNRSLIDAITTNKVNVADIIDNLTTSVSNKPLSAKQGAVLKGLIDAIKIPSALSELSEDSTHRVVTDTEKQTWNAKSNFSGSYNDLTNKPTIPTTPQQVGAEPSGTAESKVSEHNTSETSHNDIRLLIEGLTTRLNALADSDDTTLDQMSEVVTYIKSNKTLIDAITTNKVNVSDIIDNLTTSVSNKPLSAKQGVALKALIDAIKVPTKTSQLTNDSNFLTQHQDLSAYAKKATTLSGYGITDGATKEQVDQLSNEKANQSNWTPNMIIGTDANGNMVARATYTEDEKQAMMEEIIDSIKVIYPEAHVIYGDVGDGNVITLYGDITEGTYTLKYEDANGNVSEIGTLVVDSNTPTYVNWIPISTDTDGSIYNGTGWKANVRIGSDGNDKDNEQSVYFGATGFIPLVKGDVLRTSANFVSRDDQYQQLQGFFFYDANKTFLQKISFMASGNETFGWDLFTVGEDNSVVYTHNSPYVMVEGAAFVRISSSGINENAIITINEAITENSTFNVPITWILGMKLSKTDGTVESESGTNYHASDYIQLVEGASYVLSTITDTYNSMNVIYYDDNNTFVGYQADLWSSNEVENPEDGNSHFVSLIIPDGATKIRLRQYETWKEVGGSHQYITLTGTTSEGEENPPTQTFTNQIPISTDTNGAVYNEIGYKNGVRLSTSAVETAADDMGTTGFIPCKPNDTLYLENVKTHGNNSIGHYKIQFFDENKTSMGHAYFNNNDGSGQAINNETNKNAGYVEVNNHSYLTKIVLALYDSAKGTGLYANSGTITSNFRYIRVVSGTLTDDSIITVNQEITD